MNASYAFLESIWKRCQAGENLDVPNELPSLLLQQGIRTRQADGVLRQINISIPTSIQNALVIGLRYIKRDGSCTEDHFLCRRDAQGGPEIEPCYGRRLETRLAEYRGTHKERVAFGQCDPANELFTRANTITFTKTSK